MQGWRISMEDAHTHILTMSEDKDAGFFAVYDGHGGSKIAAHVSKHLHKFIVRRPEYKTGKYEDAIVKGFLECDESMRTDESLKDELSGSTAITMLFR
jgi:protein phosphatase 2C family protein 2/3